jgi:hypothetical protein
MNGNARNGYTPKSDDEHAIEHLFADFDEIVPLFEHLADIYAAVSA